MDPYYSVEDVLEAVHVFDVDCGPNIGARSSRGSAQRLVRAGFAEATARMLPYEFTADCDESFSQDRALTLDV
ncbi:hypothetical protein QA600_22095 [Natronococcus sp. A-GB1]|uniref:hypothetical protein n=1 Tax=Natronococcus sp. A-GB1 TaxID=3037648 RepID=UPI0024202178|nr:hypothetical protein [Natronococcus sp. A-GB1]MDG5762011.1 hypothetical protein [Natronococcus sp. A-GB1]